jgi:CSLREA domain-containing protein
MRLRLPPVKGRRAAALVALVTGVALVGFAAAAGTSTFKVNSAGDAADASPGDGKCRTATGTCTLRAAVMEANASAGADTIQLAAGTYRLSIPGTAENAALTGDLDVTGDLTIRGAGAARTIIDGGAVDRIFEVAAPARLSLSKLTLRNGNATGGERGGAILSNQDATLTITDAVVTRNVTGFCDHNPTAEGGEDRFCGDGGGIATLGHATLTRVTLSNNKTTSGSGGGLVNDGTIVMRQVVFRSNTGGTSAGGLMNGGDATVTNSTLVGNSAPVGGGIANGGLSRTGGPLTILNSTVVGNSTSTFGGGIADGGRFGGGPMTITNVTVSGNTADFGGGGIALNDRGTMTLKNITVVGNSGSIGGGITMGPYAGEATIRDSIVAKNVKGADCVTMGPLMTSLGSNLGSDTHCPFTAVGDRMGIDPKLGRLRMNKPGTTATYALLPGSPAIDAAASCPPPARDQRGIKRPQDGNGDHVARCDIGAYERSAPKPKRLRRP